MDKLNFKYKTYKDTVIVHFRCPSCKIEDVFIFKNNTFNHYVKKGSGVDVDRLKNDIAKAVVQYMASVPFSVDDLVSDMRMSVQSFVFKEVLKIV